MTDQARGKEDAKHRIEVEKRIEELFEEYRAYALSEDWDPDAYVDKIRDLLNEIHESGSPDIVDRQALTEFLQRIELGEDPL
jgi:hypothetical protein